MIFDLTELLDEVDTWKFAAHEQLKNMTPEERVALWKKYEKPPWAKQSRKPRAKKRGKKEPAGK